MNTLTLSPQAEILLTTFCNSREKGRKKAKIDSPAINARIYALDFQLRHNHDCVPYFFTLTFPESDLFLWQEWAHMPEFTEQLLKALSQNYLIAGGFLAFEPHKNSSLKSKRGKNTRAGRPHIHMCLWFYHTFLTPHIELLSFALQRGNFNIKTKKCNTYQDCVMAGLYTLKERNNAQLLHFSQMMGLKSNTAVIANNPYTLSLFKDFHRFAKADIYWMELLLCKTPTIRKHDDRTVMVTELFYKLFIDKGLSVWDGWVYKGRPHTQFTWDKWNTIDWWLNSQWDFSLSPTYLNMLRESYRWIKNSPTEKDTQSRPILPQLNPSMYYLEFIDGVYACDQGQLIAKDLVAPNTACISYTHQRFNHLKPPVFTLAALLELTVAGLNSTPSSKHENPKTAKDVFSLMRGMVDIGSTMHPHNSSKRAPGFYLWGPSDTFKTSMVEAWLGAVRPGHLDFVPRQKGAFNLQNLAKDGRVSYLWFADDSRWFDLGVSVGQFINILDRKTMAINPKHQRAFNKELIGSVVITSNESLESLRVDHDFASEQSLEVAQCNKEALGKRLRVIHFRPRFNTGGTTNLTQIWDLSSQQLRQTFKDEALAFMIFCNSTFLKVNPPSYSGHGLSSPHVLPSCWFTYGRFTAKNARYTHDHLNTNDPYAVGRLLVNYIQTFNRGLFAQEE